jgi:hypothetical protein
MSYDNIYLHMLDTEADEYKASDGAELGCYLHGPIKYYQVWDWVQVNRLAEDIEEHLRTRHFS